MTTTPPAPTLVPSTSGAPCPRVDVTITTMPADARTVTIWRTSASTGRRIVRGASTTPVSGDFLVVDYEVPLGEAATYTCQTTDSSGIPSLESSGTTTTVTVSAAWVQDPLDPSTALSVNLGYGVGSTFTGDSLDTVTYEMPGLTVAPVVGSAYPFAAGGVRQAVSNMVIEICVDSDAGAAALRTLLLQAFPLCLRTPQSVRGVPPLCYVSFGDLVETPAAGLTLFNFTAQAVQGPGISVIVPVRTYDDVADEATTYDLLAALYATYLDVQRG